MSVKAKVRKARKVLVASAGVAAVSFVGVGCHMGSVANLPAPPSCDVAPTDPYCIGNRPDAGPDAGADAGNSADAGADGAGDGS